MHRDIEKAMLWAMPFVLLCGVLLRVLGAHFRPLALWPFLPLNASAWEQSKMLAWPLLAYLLAAFVRFRLDPCAYATAALLSLVSGVGAMLAGIWALDGIDGQLSLWLSFAASSALSPVVLARALRCRRCTVWPATSMLAIACLLCCYVAFSFIPPGGWPFSGV